MNHISQKKNEKEGEMALKLDMSKVYDRVEWSGLKQIVFKMGFHAKWVNTIMQCLTSITYSIRINGVPQGHITPTKGLRQGDPLSPYLFCCVQRDYHRKATLEGTLHGISICRRGPQLSHLFFADNCLLFCHANIEECEKLMRILHVYVTFIGQ